MNIYYFHTAKIKKNENTKVLSNNARKLLMKFAVICGSTFVFTFPLVCLVIYYVITRNEVSAAVSYSIIVFTGMSSVVNPCLLYFLDARIKNTINDTMRSIHQTKRDNRINQKSKREKEKKPLAIGIPSLQSQEIQMESKIAPLASKFLQETVKMSTDAS